MTAPPTVCIVTRPDLFPANHGAAVRIVRTAEHLSRAGARVLVVTDDRDRYLRVEEGRFEEVAYPPRFRAAEEWPPLSRVGRWAERLCRQLGYPDEELFLYRPLFDPAWWGRVTEVGRVERVDVFQAEFPGYGVPAVVAARLLGAGRRLRGGRRPHVCVVEHNVEWERLHEFGHDVRHIRRVETGILKLADDVVTVSSEDRRRLVAAGVDGASVTVIPHGVDFAALARAAADPTVGARVRARYGIPAKAPLLFFHGTLHYWPNTEAVRFVAEQLLPRLLSRVPEARVLICGLNPPTYYAHPAITFPGPVDDLAEHIAAADLCICPLFAGGGTRLKLFEYMAAGKATVSTTKGAEGIPVDGEMALADGADAFAGAVVALLGDPGRRREMGGRARAFARRYDWPRIAEAFLSLYRGEGRGVDWNERLRGESDGAEVPSLPPLAEAPAVEAHLPPRTPSKPLTLLLLINRGCNLRCVFCDLWSDHRNMPVDERVVPLFDEALAIGTRTLVLTGGEPFLHPDLFRAVRAAKARGMGVNITTNGTLLDRRWEEVVTSGVDSLSFSVDGLETTHDRLRGRKGAWQRTMAAMERVIAHGGIGVSVYFTVTRDNVRELVEVYEQVRALGARFDFWPVNDAPDLYLRTEDDARAWREAVAHIAARETDVAERVGYYLRGLDYHAGRMGPVRCLGFVDQYGVRFDGALLPCCVWGGDGLVVGNVFERPLRELWHAPEVQRFREQMFAQGCAAGCFNHSLYEFERSTRLPFEVPKR